jgi:cyanophycinase
MTYFPRLFFIVAAGLIGLSCKKGIPGNPAAGPGGTNPIPTAHVASLGFVGDTTDVTPAVTSGLVLMGGGTDVDAAIKWMISKSGGGNAVVIRATGTDAYNSYIKGLGTLKSVETLLINSRTLANDESVARVIRNAELLFIAGGDQSDYMNFWRGTKTEEAINYLLNTKKAPVGGTSAGCAILGKIYYSGENGSVTSAEALANPYSSTVTLYKNDFLNAPFLENVVTDQHYITRTRQGRHMAFLGRIIKDWNIFPKGIAIDERTAVCIDEIGTAKVFGSSKAYFLITDAAKPPEQCVTGLSLKWSAANTAVKVFEVQGLSAGSGSFSVVDFDPAKAAGGSWFWWWVSDGVFSQSPA